MASRLREGPPIEHPIGHVADAFQDADGKEWAVIALKPQYARTNAAIVRGDLKAVSLTSCSRTPIELAVTPDPARPKSDILFAARTFKSAADYKLDLIEGAKSADSIIMAAAAPEPFSFEKALAAMDPEARAAFEKRYASIAEKLAAAEKADAEKKALIEKYKQTEAEYHAAANADKAVLQDTLERFKAVTDPKHQSAYGVGDACFKQVMDAENPEVIRRNVERIITVANRSMAAAAAAAAASAPASDAQVAPERDEAPLKRRRAEPEVAAPESTMTPLERAFAENFE